MAGRITYTINLQGHEYKFDRSTQDLNYILGELFPDWKTTPVNNKLLQEMQPVPNVPRGSLLEQVINENRIIASTWMSNHHPSEKVIKLRADFPGSDGKPAKCEMTVQDQD